MVYMILRSYNDCEGGYMPLNIGKRIKALRKNKNITQDELAEVLNISPQSVSKWETGNSIPDVELLPIIARYFGITMDELFNYKIDSLNYKERFILFMLDNGVLKFGKFKLHSGRISPYIINSSNYKTSSQITKLGQFYAECIRENNLIVDTLVGDSNEDTPGIIATSMYLYQKYGIDANYSIINSIGKLPDKNGDLILIKDTLTSGNTIINALKMIKDKASNNIKNIIVAVDRMERTNNGYLTAKEQIEKDYKVKVYPIITLDDIINSIENGVVPAFDYLEALKEYKKEYGSR